MNKKFKKEEKIYYLQEILFFIKDPEPDPDKIRSVKWDCTGIRFLQLTLYQANTVAPLQPFETAKCFFYRKVPVPVSRVCIALRRRQTKSSPIFAKLLHLVLRGALSSELFEFLRYLFPFQRYTKFSVFFFNSAGYL